MFTKKDKLLPQILPLCNTVHPTDTPHLSQRVKSGISKKKERRIFQLCGGVKEINNFLDTQAKKDDAGKRNEKVPLKSSKV